MPSEGGVWRSEPGEYGEDIHIFTSNDALIERRFYLDPEQGGAIARVEVWRNGQRLARSELENHLTNGVWFPSLVQEFVREEPFAQNRWRFSDFVFEKGKLPVRLSPTDIGVEVGTTVIVTEPGHEPRVNIWNGKDLEAQDSALRRLRTGDLQYGEQILLERARAGAGEDVYETVCLEAAARLDECWNTRPFDSPHEKLWEVYVRQFIQDNHLNQETQARAWQIRSDCAADVAHRQKRALLRKHLDGEKRDRELSQIADEVFAEQLIPRLKSLLTREQLNRESHSISP